MKNPLINLVLYVGETSIPQITANSTTQLVTGEEKGSY